MTSLYISADIEGITGVVSPRQCTPSGDPVAYTEAVAAMEREVTEVVQVALKLGVKGILVNDAHMHMTNLRQDRLPDEVRLLSGKPKDVAMAAGLNSAFDAALFIGYHARAGTQNAVLCHTFHTKLYDVRINGTSYGEGGINALYAGIVHKVPVILASGDEAFCREFEEVSPRTRTIATKEALGFAAAENRPLKEVLADYREALKALMAEKRQWKEAVAKLKGPYELEVTFINALCADVARMLPGWERLDGTRLRFTSEDFHEVYLALQSVYSIQAYTAAQDALM